MSEAASRLASPTARARTGSVAWPYSRQSACVSRDQFVQFGDAELAQLDDGGLATIDDGQHVSRLVLAVYVDDDPPLVYAVMTTEISMRQKMRAGLQEHFDGARARDHFFFMGNLYEELGHDAVSYVAA